MHKGVLLVIALGVLVAPGVCRAQDKLSIAVLPFKSGPGVDQKTSELITENLVTEIQERRGYRVLSTREIEAALGYERQRQLLGCSSESSCLTEIGGALGVDKLLMGTLGKLGGSLIFNVQIVDMRSGLVERRYSKRIKGSSEEVFLDAVTAAVEDLFPAVQKKKPPVVQAPPPPPKPLDKAAPAPAPPHEPVETVAETHTEGPAFARWNVALRGQYWPLSAPANGGAISLLAGMALTPSLSVSLGPMASAVSVGGLLRAGWVPLNAEGNIRPVVAIEVPLLLTRVGSQLTTGAGVSLGVEYLPTPWLFVAADVPIYFLPVIPKENPNVWVFGSISAGVRI